LASPNGVGFDFPSQTAHLFSFSASDVNVTPTPEPSTGCLLLVGAGMAIAASRRHPGTLRLVFEKGVSPWH
jgi:hypothetical protein